MTFFILYSRPAGTRFISAYRPEQSRYFGFSRLVSKLRDVVRLIFNL